jgi:hypothetical protein
LAIKNNVRGVPDREPEAASPRDKSRRFGLSSGREKTKAARPNLRPGCKKEAQTGTRLGGNGTAKTQAGKITAREKEIQAETLSGKNEDLRVDRAEPRAGSLAARSERDLTEERDCS